MPAATKSPIINGRDLQDELNRLAPAAGHVKLGDIINDLISQHNALLAKLDMANLAGMGTTNVATISVPTLVQRLTSL